MTREEVRDLMLSSRTPEEWDDNCDKVKIAFKGDYPSWWYETIILSGLLEECKYRWLLRPGG